jgi:KDO2-lipid IV(A) lauroyltransferase
MLIGFLRWFGRHAGRWSLVTQRRVGRVLGWVLGRIVRFRRRAVLATLALRLPGKSRADYQAIADGMYRHLGTMAVECMGFPDQPREIFQRNVEMRGEEHAHGVLAQGRGMLVLMGHIGNWELLGLALAGRWVPIHVIVREQHDKAFNTYWRESREKMGLHPMAAQHSYRDALRALKKGDMVAVTLDQNMRRRRGVFVNFFGEQACTTPGLAYLSAQSGVPVVPIYTIRQPDGRHVVQVLPPVPPPADREEATIQASTQVYSDILEGIIRQHPDQWLWLHKRWRTRPEQAIPPSRRMTDQTPVTPR